MPVWADAFASEKQKAAWFTFLILASPLGVIIGYLMTSFYVGHYAASHNIDQSLSPGDLGF